VDTPAGPDDNRTNLSELPVAGLSKALRPSLISMQKPSMQF
jgi:hypothetical protein